MVNLLWSVEARRSTVFWGFLTSGLPAHLLKIPELLPNKRLKLTAPALQGRIAFVITLTVRRSLGAVR